MSQPNDLSRSLVALDQDSTIIAGIRLLLMLSGYSSADDIPCINPLRSQQAYFVMGVNLAVEPSKIPTQGCIIR